MQWLPLLREVIEAEFHSRRVVAAFATADLDGTPHVRHVIVRRIDDDGSHYVTSHALSAKHRQLSENPKGEICFWLAGWREQYRISGNCELIHAGKVRQQIWREIADGSRALALWPAPGEPRTAPPEAFTHSLPPDAPIPETFELIKLIPERVEHLELNSHPHRRRVWERSGEWAVKEINP